MLRPFVVLLAILLLVPLASAAKDVRVMGGFYAPDGIEIAVGETVTWTNDDSMPHTVTSTWDAGESFDAILRSGESFSWTFAEEGAFQVHCRPHAYPNDATGTWEGMVMSIDVAPLGTGASIGESVKSGTPAPGPALVSLALVGAAMLLRRRAP